ncbi:MAG: hypothetical protein ACXVJD_12515 [Mucilaginibacter sp.]
MKQLIELRKTRDFGQIINDSFTFFKENFKPLFSALIIICGIFILLGTITTVFTYTNMLSIYSGNFTPVNNYYDRASYTEGYLLSVVFNGLVMFALHSSIFLVTLCYIAVYLQKENSKPAFEEIWGYFKYYILRVFGSGIVLMLLLIAGFLFCLIPGIYLMPVVYLIIPIIVIENASFGYAFNKSFRLIKDNWWLVFGVIFIMSLIVGIASSISSIPLTLIPLAGKFVSLKGFETLPVIIIFSAVKNVLQLLYMLPAIAIALCYFSLSEEKDGLGLIDRIENFGKANNEGPILPAEEY